MPDNDTLARTSHGHVSRRRFVQGIAAAGAVAAFGRQAIAKRRRTEQDVLTGDRFDLLIEETEVNITGWPRPAITVNGSIPAPLLRMREGDTVTINVTNRLRETTSIHWHGILLPANMDGVPGLSFPGIRPGETFTYRFLIQQSGTYWYHSHSGAQEQLGLYGPLILEPRSSEAYAYDRDYVVELSDWTDEDPWTIISNLKQQSDYYNFQQRTLGTFFKDIREKGLGPTVSDRLTWAGMRMSPTDIMDVTGAAYTFLVNGQPPAANWTALFKPGERVRLRFINSAAMSTFDVRIPGLLLRIVQADGTDVEPVEVEEFRIGVAETYDVIVEPRGEQAYTIFAQAQDRSGFARGTLAIRPGMSSVIPPMEPRPIRTMADMGMGDMAGMNMGRTKGMPGMDHGAMPASPAPPHGGTTQMPGMDTSMPGMNHGPVPMGSSPGARTQMTPPMQDMPGMQAMPGMDHGSMPGMRGMDIPDAKPPTENASGVDPATLPGQRWVDNVARMPRNRLAEAGTGLDGNGRRVLTYAQLRARHPTHNAPPEREIEFHLTGNMQRWVWGFDGKKFSEAPPVRVKLGARVRFVLTNDTMMEHPIHLHGFLFAVENAQGAHLPLKHTINVKPGERMSFLYTADVPGHWAFHCHLLFHMETGMFRTIVVA
jgi:FtsP/CotA-like multicopper oxidase with cupredoxin domain